MHNLSVCNESQRLSADCEVVKKNKKQKTSSLQEPTQTQTCGAETRMQHQHASTLKGRSLLEMQRTSSRKQIKPSLENGSELRQTK